jgi:hypothetical protein
MGIWEYGKRVLMGLIAICTMWLGRRGGWEGFEREWETGSGGVWHTDIGGGYGIGNIRERVLIPTLPIFPNSQIPIFPYSPIPLFYLFAVGTPSSRVSVKGYADFVLTSIR